MHLFLIWTIANPGYFHLIVAIVTFAETVIPSRKPALVVVNELRYADLRVPQGSRFGIPYWAMQFMRPSKLTVIFCRIQSIVHPLTEG